MPDTVQMSFRTPDEVVELPKMTARIVELDTQRVMAAAAADESPVSRPTRDLASASGLAFEDRGTHELKGLEDEWPLAAFMPESVATT